MENLRKFRARDVIQRFQTFCASVDIVRTDHCSDVGQRPVGNLAVVGEYGQIRFGIRIVVQFQRTGNDRHSLLTRDRRVRGHCRAAASVVCAHLDGERNIFVVPLVLGNVLVLRNIRRLVAAERPVDDRGHFCAGHIAIRVKRRTGFAVKQAVIHSGANRFGVPCGTVIVLEICCFAGSRSCRRRADCQR